MKTSKKLTVTGSLIMPDLNPRDTDVKYTGGEPVFSSQPSEEGRTGALMKAFNWYSKYFDRKMAKEQFANYADFINNKDLSRKIRKVDDKVVNPSMGWLARLSMRGLQLTDSERTRIDADIQRMISTLSVEETVEVVKEVTTKVNVQEVMRERTKEVAGELEGLLDEFILNGAKAATANVNVVGLMSEKNILPQHTSIISDIWKKKIEEFNTVLESNDSYIIESYSQFNKHQIKALIKFCEAVLAGVDSYINVKKVTRAPRKRKAVSPEKQVNKIKFLKAFEELKLVSVHPAKILGSTEVWAYDVEKRKLHYYVADSHVGTLGVKGASILGYDTSKSGVKTLRKPAELLKKLMSAGKPASRKLFTEINAVHAQPNGRTNDNLIFLKVY